MGRIIIEGNRCYEIDEECMRKKQEREAKNERNREMKDERIRERSDLRRISKRLP